MVGSVPTNRGEYESVYEAGRDAVVTAFTLLVGEKTKLEAQVQELKARLSKNSRNSGKPPSSDGLARKPQSLREKSGRTTGGQRGHEGTTLEMRDVPDWIEVSAPPTCAGCGGELGAGDRVRFERRQVFDQPVKALEVTEHRAEIRCCPRCKTLTRGTFPEGVAAPVQYGPRVRSTLVYFHLYQFLPYGRTCETMKDLFDVTLSQGTVESAVRAASEQLEATETAIRTAITGAAVANFDETGLRVKGKLHWLHSASSGPWVAYSAQEKRGHGGMEAAGILPQFKGRAIHDEWKPYFKFDCAHGLCNVHRLRELTYLHEKFEQSWAGKMKGLLIEMKSAVEAARARGKTALAPGLLNTLLSRYDRLLTQGETANPVPVGDGTPRKGRPKRTPAQNLLARLRQFRAETLAFLTDFSVPFSNNRAERDVRMVKVKQKVSGGFRALQGAQDFSRIRGYLATARNQSLPVLEALRQVFLGRPLDLVSDA